MPAIHTRIATLQDVDAVAVLFDAYRQFYEQTADLPLATQFIADRIRNNESVILLAEDDHHQAVGFCQLYPTFCSVAAQPIYSLYDLYVAPHGRKAGTGHMLLLAAEALARTKGMVRMDLTTAKTNLPAQALYASLGWVRDEVFFAYSRPIAV